MEICHPEAGDRSGRHGLKNFGSWVSLFYVARATSRAITFGVIILRSISQLNCWSLVLNWIGTGKESGQIGYDNDRSAGSLVTAECVTSVLISTLLALHTKAGRVWQLCTSAVRMWPTMRALQSVSVSVRVQITIGCATAHNIKHWVQSRRKKIVRLQRWGLRSAKSLSDALLGGGGRKHASCLYTIYLKNPTYSPT